MQAAINLTNPDSNQWTIKLADVTTGQMFQRTLTYASSKLSAEWIVERPIVNNVLSELANFGNATLTDCQAVGSGAAGSITFFPSYECIMYGKIANGNATDQLVTVSDLSFDGSEFTVTYLTS